MRETPALVSEPALRILFAASEVTPYSKTGGLADVAWALPAELARQGHQVLVVTPRYGSVKVPDARPVGEPFTLRFPFGEEVVRLFALEPQDNLRIVFVDTPRLSWREGLYGEEGRDFHDNSQRFALFGMAALTAAQALRFVPDVVHCNDWQTGLMPLALKRAYRRVWPGARSVLTIHNLAYQGVFPKHELDVLGLPWELFTVDGLEYWGHLSYLKAGLVWADALTTVSPSYAREIQTKPLGMGMEGVMQARAHVLRGIRNGVDVLEWNPATDALLPHRFSAQDVSGKQACQVALLERAKLPPPPAGLPVFGVIGRMVDQKGVDLLLGALPPWLEHGARVVVLGSGAAQYEDGWRRLEARLPTCVRVTIGYDDGLAHLIEAGADFFIMPSRFEPCGLNQMYSQLYGAVPIVHAVGGLKDTVSDVTQADGSGVVFTEATVDGLRRALSRALALFRDPTRYREVQRRGMARDFSWAAPARDYVDVYRSLLRTR